MYLFNFINTPFIQKIGSFKYIVVHVILQFKDFGVLLKRLIIYNDYLLTTK